MFAQSQHLKAAVVMVGAMAILGVIDNFVVRVAEQIGLWQFHMVRAALAIPLIVALSWVGLGALRPLRLWAVALRSALIGVAMLFYFSALALMPIAQALAGLFTSPIFVLLISALILGEKIGVWRVMAVGLGFAGTLFVLQPDPDDFDMLLLLPVAGGVFYAMGVIATKRLCAEESTLTMLLGILMVLGLAGAVGLLWLGVFPSTDIAAGPSGFVARGWVWPMGDVFLWVCVQAVGSVAGVYLIIKAYQLGEPSYVSVFEYSIMIFGPLFAWLAFGQFMTLWQVFGIALITTAGGIIAIRSK